MSIRTLLLVAVPSILFAATALVLADVLDAPGLAVVGLVGVVVLLGARERWQWHGAGREWLLGLGALAAVMAIAFVVSAIAH